MYPKLSRQNGFTLMSAIFILVILALGAGFIVQIAAISRTTATYSIQGTRAFFSARSGIEWGVHRVVADPTQCPPTTTLNLSQGGLNTFSVQVTCAVNSFTEGPTTYNVFRLTAVATRGTYGGADYVSRRMETLVTQGT